MSSAPTIVPLGTSLITEIPQVSPPVCNGWQEPIRCPLIIFIIIVILAFIWNIVIVVNLPPIDRQGQPITTGQKWGIGVVILIIYLLVAFIFGRIIYGYCRRCDGNRAWITFFIFILLPIIIAIVLGVVIGASYGLTLFFMGNNE